MSSILGSQGLVLATAVVVSSSVLFLTFSRQKHSPSDKAIESPSTHKQILRSCLCSEEKKRERKKNKKRVQFAVNVKEHSESSVLVKQKDEKSKKSNRGLRSCREEIPENRGMPENRIALYNGILRDRVHRMECIY